MPYIGKQPEIGAYKKLDSITAVNGQAAYTLQHNSANYSPASANHLIVSLNGVIQAPQDSFTVSGSTLTFASNLSTGDSIDFILALGDVLSVGTPSDNTVTSAKIVDGTIVNADINTSAAIAGSKLADDSVTEAKLDIHAAPSGTDKVLGYTSNGMEWVESAAGATGGGTDKIFWENGQTVTTNYTITNGYNAMSAGPVTINNGVAVTIGTGENWTIV